jgi:hypothetical protein
MKKGEGMRKDGRMSNEREEGESRTYEEDKGMREVKEGRRKVK